MFNSIRKWYAQRLVYRQTIKELRSLTKRELYDLGIDESMITSVASEAAYGVR